MSISPTRCFGIVSNLAPPPRAANAATRSNWCEFDQRNLARGLLLIVGVGRINREQLRPYRAFLFRRQRACSVLSASASDLRLDLGIRGEVQVPRRRSIAAAVGSDQVGLAVFLVIQQRLVDRAPRLAAARREDQGIAVEQAHPAEQPVRRHVHRAYEPNHLMSEWVYFHLMMILLRARIAGRRRSYSCSGVTSVPALLTSRARWRGLRVPAAPLDTSPQARAWQRVGTSSTLS